MCGKFVLVSNIGQISEEFNLTGFHESVLPRGDMLPGQKCACVIAAEKKNILLNMRWGFPPRWPTQTAARLLINARAETLSEKPTFKESFQRRRCVIPADGFYEWSKDRKQFCFYLRNQRSFGLAGIYEENKTPVEKETSFVIITTAPNKLIEQVHNRMPVIIPADKQALWLNNARFDKSELDSLFIPYPAEKMEMCPGKYPLQ
ncbi:MAG: SOS response-associated peptidase [Syntrophaceae bacterium]|nr:SOS response-associated peptidase [Syntrophaceae bacterium]